MRYPGDELKRRWTAIAGSIEAMGVEAGELLVLSHPIICPRPFCETSKPRRALLRPRSGNPQMCCVSGVCKQFEELVAARHGTPISKLFL